MVTLLILFFFLNSYLNEIVNRYPPLQECSTVEGAFEGDREEFKKYALIDKDAAIDGHGQGQYQCFCKSDEIEVSTDF